MRAPPLGLMALRPAHSLAGSGPGRLGGPGREAAPVRGADLMTSNDLQPRPASVMGFGKICPPYQCSVGTWGFYNNGDSTTPAIDKISLDHFSSLSSNRQQPISPHTTSLIVFAAQT